MRTIDHKFSLTVIGHKLGVNSTGLLADVMAGRRKLNSRHIDAVCSLFQIDGVEKFFLKMLHEKEKSRSVYQRAELQRKIHGMRECFKALSLDAGPKLPSGLLDSLLPVTVYCAVGLLKPPVHRVSIMKLFKDESTGDLEYAIEQLLLGGMMSEQQGIFTTTRTITFFADDTDGEKQRTFIKHCIRDAERQVDRWFKQPGRSYIQSFFWIGSTRRVREGPGRT